MKSMLRERQGAHEKNIMQLSMCIADHNHVQILFWRVHLHYRLHLRLFLCQQDNRKSAVVESVQAYIYQAGLLL